MTNSSDPVQLDPQQWEAVDALLDELLDLDPPERGQRLDQIGQRHPEWVKLLNRLVSCSGNAERLDQTLLTALTFLADQEPVPTNTRIGPWKLGARIGTGGMAEVYLAERADGAFEQTVALKLLWPGLAGSHASKRFQRERQILAALDDPRIARLLDGGVTDEGRPWLAMEYVAGETITRYCNRQRLSLERRLELFSEVSGALAAAHRRLVIHGDIKPANVLIVPPDEPAGTAQVKVLDFGIGQLLDETATHPESANPWPALTPDYASPEQHSGLSLTTASDVFQLGRLLQDLLVGAVNRQTRNEPAGRIVPLNELLARKSPTALARLARQRSTSPASLRRFCNGPVQALLDRALASHPDQRYRGVDALIADVQALLHDFPLTAQGSGLIYRTRCFARRHWPALALATTLGVLGLAGLYGHFSQARLIAEESATNQAVLAYLEDMLRGGDPNMAGDRPLIATALLDDTARRLDSELDGQHAAQARVLTVLGEVFLARGDGVRARQMHEKALDLALTHDLPEALDRSRSGLAAAGIWSGDYARAEKLQRQALAMRLRRWGESSRQVAESRLNLADLLHSRGLYEQAARLAETVLNGNHFPAWRGRVAGMILRDQGRFDEAEQHFLTTIRLERGRSDQVRHNLAASLEHYAQLMLHTGRVEAARDALTQALALRLERLGSEWEGLIWTRHWQGLSELAQGSLEAADDLLETTVTDYRRAFTESSHLLAFARSDLGWVALARGQPARAEGLFKAARTGLEAVQVDAHPRLAEILMGLALTQLAHGNPADGHASAERALAIRRTAFSSWPLATDWLTTACEVVQATGGSCVLAANPPESYPGLDRLKLEQARRGLCQMQPELADLQRFCVQPSVHAWRNKRNEPNARTDATHDLLRPGPGRYISGQYPFRSSRRQPG